MVPNQRMAFARDAVLAGPGHDLVRVFVVRFAALVLVARPIEAQRAGVEERGNPLPILFLQLGLATAAKHEEVAAEEKVVAKLLHLDLCPVDGFALCIPQGDGAVAHAVLCNARLGLSEDLVVARLGFRFLGAPGGVAEQQGGGAGAGSKECSSIHSYSKHQPTALLKPKILLCAKAQGARGNCALERFGK